MTGTIIRNINRSSIGHLPGLDQFLIYVYHTMNGKGWGSGLAG